MITNEKTRVIQVFIPPQNQTPVSLPVIRIAHRLFIDTSTIVSDPDPARLRRARLEFMAWIRYTGVETGKLMQLGASPDDLRLSEITPLSISLPEPVAAMVEKKKKAANRAVSQMSVRLKPKTMPKPQSEPESESN